MKSIPCSSLSIILFLISFNILNAQPGYYNNTKLIKEFDFNERQLPSIPDSQKPIRVIIDTDAKNEVDDQWAIALERMKIEGFVAANFDNAYGGPSSIDKSYEEILLILER